MTERITASGMLKENLPSSPKTTSYEKRIRDLGKNLSLYAVSQSIPVQESNLRRK